MTNSPISQPIELSVLKQGPAILIILIIPFVRYRPWLCTVKAVHLPLLCKTNCSQANDVEEFLTNFLLLCRGDFSVVYFHPDQNKEQDKVRQDDVDDGAVSTAKA